MKTYQLWNPDPEGWCLLVDTTDIIQVVDNGEGWLSSGYEPEDLLIFYRESGESYNFYKWVKEEGYANCPEFFYSDENETIIEPDGTMHENFDEAFWEYDLAVRNTKGRLIWQDTSETVETELEQFNQLTYIGKLHNGSVLVVVYSIWQGVDPIAKIMTAEEFFEWKEVGECS